MNSEQLTKAEFDTHIRRGTLRISFVGMSNAGKSYHSRVLQEAEGFLWYQVDAAIQDALQFENMEQISTWLGMPTSETYGERELTYLELEDRFTQQAAMKTNGKNLVFDTTGSVVHLNPDTLSILRDNCLVAHLDVGEDSLQEMMGRFLSDPKPVAWSGNFTSNSGETQEETFKRCYALLLENRLKAYRGLAHISIPAEELRDRTGKEVLEILKSHLAS